VYRLLIGALAAGALMAGPAVAQTTTHSTTSKATTTKSTAPAAKATGVKTAMPGRFFTGKPNMARYRELSTRELDLARADLKKLLAVKGKRTIQNTLTLYSSLTLHADNAGSWAGLMESVHPDSAFRSTAEAMSQDASRFFTELGLNRQVYDAIQAVDVSAADPTTKYLVEKTLRDFRLAGVDKDEATRKQIQAIQDELVLVSQEFDRNIRNDSRKIQVTPAELDGMPDDFMKAHPPGADGKITLSIEYPDRFPVATYAKNGDVRKRLQFEAMNRAYPANEAVLDSMLDKRYRLARMLGYPTWADYITANKMIENAANAAQFIDRIGRLTREQSQREYEVYLKRKQEDVPGATAVNRWEVRYYEQLIRKRDYNFDPSAARPYFPFEGVKKGVLDVTSKLYGVTYKRIQHPDVWDPSVEAYDVYDGKTLLGRFFFDLHPRPGKFNHAAQFNIRTGVTGLQLPEACLVCNFPGGTKGDPGLMEHDDVVTFFHEFGHLLHSIFGGHQRWAPLAGIATEQDFVEAPSQMLEEWAWDPAVLRTFAKHYQTGEAIPIDMVENLRKSSVFGRAIDNAYQADYAALSLNIYNRDPATVNVDSLAVRFDSDFVPFPPIPDTHYAMSFGHLDGYSAVYYTYLWSLVIAKDLFTKFDRDHMLAPGAATRYRKVVLAPGGTKPAAQLVHDFLGRDFQYDAYEQWLAGKN
jgi:thimet oligopeptidase